jgi:hypothetical protein
MSIDTIIETLIEEVDKAIPDDLKQKLQSMEFRKGLLAKHGEKAFLDPSRLKFPIYDESGPNCQLLYAAYLRAATWAAKGSDVKGKSYYTKIKKSAKSQFNSNKCSESLSVTLQEGDSMDLIDLTEMFEYNSEDVELEFIYAE